MRLALGTFALLLPVSLSAQAVHHEHGLSVVSSSLALHGLGGRNLVLTIDDFKALPHTSITVANGHSHNSETYTGVALTVLLAKVGLPQGTDLKGSALMIGIVAEGADGYQVLYALPEADATFHVGDVLVADSLDGKSLGEAGNFKLVSSQDKRPARWVRNLKSISGVMVKP